MILAWSTQQMQVSIQHRTLGQFLSKDCLVFWFFWFSWAYLLYLHSLAVMSVSWGLKEEMILMENKN